MPPLHHLLPLTLLLSTPQSTLGDFVYPDFNKTIGLTLNGASATTSCEVGIDILAAAGYPDVNDTADDWGETHGNADTFEDTTFTQQGERGNMQTARRVDTNVHGESTDIKNTEARFGHRAHFVQSKTTRCGTRVRLTPSAPSTAGSFFRTERLPISQGFDTKFEFHVSDHSRTCSSHMDPTFGLSHHKSCAVHGGDGLAFVIHNDPAAAAALGGTGNDLGYAGITNGLAVELDMWTNTPSVHMISGDLFEDHVAVQASGPGGVLTSDVTTSMGASRDHQLADGQVHIVRVKYVPYIETKYLAKMTASKLLPEYMKDNGESRRIGTLSVFIDEGVDNDDPVISFPVNLSVLMDLPQGYAYAGFTASTGEKWQKHDLLNWQWCDYDNCDAPTDDTSLYDYHSQSKFYNARHNYNQPGEGYGGAQAKSGPFTGDIYSADGKIKGGGTVHANMDTRPWGENEQSRGATGYSDQLFSGAGQQVPPATEN